ncbi:MAG: helix-turn-helix domain-containing protein [Egibacteraceae bacterium]
MAYDTHVMGHDQLLHQVRELREAGRSPKDIAHALNVRPSTIAPLVRAIAQQAAAAQPEPELVGCWVSPGWSTGQPIDGHEEWPDSRQPDSGIGGLVSVAVARRHRPQRVSACGYLVDKYCLGVKNALGPRIMNERDLPAFVRTFFSAYEEVGPPLAAPLDLARHLVWGAIDYARGLGFPPHPDFQPAAGHLGPWRETSAITFGQDGAPLYVQGPYDDADAVLRTLAASVGQGNFHYLVQVV